MLTKTYKFFIITPPELVDLAADELRDVIVKENITAEIKINILKKEGIEVETDLFTGVRFNFYLKIPTRIILRIAEFKCRDFPKLYKKASKINWKDFIWSNDISIEATAKKSRLINTKKISDAIKNAVDKSLKASPLKKEILDKNKDIKQPDIYVRIINDLCTISVDTTGEPLYKRGQRVSVCTAPIRESLLFSLLYFSYKKHPEIFSNAFNFIDPMCGSGVSLLEAHDFFSYTKRDDFVFKYFPIITSSAPSNVFVQNSSAYNSPFIGYIGADIDQDAVLAANQNLKDITHKTIFKHDIFGPSPQIDLKEYSLSFVFINPPYGKRIAIEESMNQYYKRLIQSACSGFAPIFFGILLPRDVDYKQILRANNIKKFNILKVKNGGIALNFLLLQMNS